MKSADGEDLTDIPGIKRQVMKLMKYWMSTVIEHFFLLKNIVRKKIQAGYL